MKKLLLALGISAFSIAAPMAAYAQAVDFSVADADGNGEVTMEELMEALPDVSADAAAEADTDEDGVLSQEEYDALVSQ
ncbi:MAG: hypothetical protein P1V21_07540 [Rhizobiaceae bacterium]|nr:hypothetical protein [Rhizobiaceae bacterium]MDF2370634.1 hypothetical protein [Rhizobiaceae bacterium]|tara:strand:- start:73 stop:309 length:237 start_codon:yes stop_codon:yes gene_type:complete